MSRTPTDDRLEQSNMTPMIDVVFQLLIFFMLSMHFQEIEGRLLSTLPKSTGTFDGTPPPELQEIRIILCAGGDTAGHRTDKGRHETLRKDASRCRVMVEGRDLGELLPGRDNRGLFRAVARVAAELLAITPSSRDPRRRAPVILDADGEIPYEHVIGILNACQEADIHNVEFAANSRFMKYAK
jgi:biopolymer transport protein ExbD